MKIPPNVVLGLVGALVALVTGAVIASNWEQLTNLQRYEARFELDEEIVRDRAGTLSRSAPVVEVYPVPYANVTEIRLDLTWQDPSGLTASPPEVTLRLLDPAGLPRASASHRGGLSGIHLTYVHIPPEDIPTGTHAFDARGEDVARSIFETRWPAHPETVGNWTVELTAGDGGAVTYSIHLTYLHYAGTWARFDLAGVK